MEKKCSMCNNTNIWVFKILILFILIFIFYFSIVYYYKSLNNIKQRELSGL